MLSFSFVVLLHVFGAIVALIPQYFYFRDVAPMTLEPMLTQMRSMKGMGSPADVEQMIESIRGISLLQWLYMGDDHGANTEKELEDYGYIRCNPTL